MTKIFMVSIIISLLSSCAFAGTIETITLIETQGQSKIDLLIGASDEQLAKYFPDGNMNSQILAFLVKFGGNEILFDTGLKGGNIPAELAKNGTNPEDVKIILLTHLHPDHFGGLVDGTGKAAFPNADVYVGRVERSYWVDELKNENVIAALKLYESRLHTFDFGDEVVAGVKAIDTTGHTPGHTAFLIESEGDKLLIVGDIMHFQAIQLPVPDIAVRYDTDPEMAVRSRKFILDYASMKGIPIAGMHMTPPGIMNVKKAGNGYEVY